MNVTVLTTIETILDRTRPADPTDYREWGRRAGHLLAEYPDQAEAFLVEAMTAKARQRVAREQARTRDGIARFVADSTTGQLVAWPDSTDAPWLRDTGRKLVAEGEKKIRLGQLMQQAADCVEAHPGLSAREAWAAEGLDAAEIDAVETAIAL